MNTNHGPALDRLLTRLNRQVVDAENDVVLIRSELDRFSTMNLEASVARRHVESRRRKLTSAEVVATMRREELSALLELVEGAERADR